MNNNRYIELVEKYFSFEISENEKEELDAILEKDPDKKNEFEEQKKIMEVMKKMTLSNPKKEFWDTYWINLYNRIERGIAWIIISIGAIILFGYGAVKAVSQLIEDTTTPLVIKYGLAILAVGVVILLISLIREKWFSSKKDKYKEIQR